MKRILDYSYLCLRQVKQSIIHCYNERKLYEQIEQSTIQYLEQLEADRRSSIKPLLQEELTCSYSALRQLVDEADSKAYIIRLIQENLPYLPGSFQHNMNKLVALEVAHDLICHLEVVRHYLNPEPGRQAPYLWSNRFKIKDSVPIVLRESKMEVKKVLLESWGKIMKNSLLKEVLPLPEVCVELIRSYDDFYSSDLLKPGAQTFMDIISDYMFIGEDDYSTAIEDLLG